MEVQLRSPKEIMKLSRLGCFHQSKLSFKIFLEEFKDWKYSRDLFDLNKDGFGKAIYSFSKNNRTYSLVCFANKLQDEERSDRVIATGSGTLHSLYMMEFQQNLILKDFMKMYQNKRLERLSYKELTLSRANRSVRLFNKVIDSFSNGIQPDKKLLAKGWLLYIELLLFMVLENLV